MSSSPKVSIPKSAFNPTSFFALASWFFDTKLSPPSSCLIRTIINRSYYAALICAREFTGTSTQGSKGHTAVIDALRPIDDYAANKLNSLRLKRRKADYELNSSLTERDAQLSLQEARLVLYVSKFTVPPGKPYTTDFLDSSRFLSNTP